MGLTIRQQRLLCMALQELFWACAVHAIGVSKRGCWLNLLHSHLVLLWVDLALVLNPEVQGEQGTQFLGSVPHKSLLRDTLDR